ncbi:hypothetical protein Taro_027866 [Colocasia esculenta]|uniref:Uncharacterized protein n=1 Tax=Colocasia esculenta TaxID=4460 RepID=A0A843VF00_COLES|nr:hypothetical protein [Colocasia esculenta]
MKSNGAHNRPKALRLSEADHLLSPRWLARPRSAIVGVARPVGPNFPSSLCQNRKPRGLT